MVSKAVFSRFSQDGARQKLRMRRMLMAVVLYVTCALMLWGVSWLGFLPQWFPVAWVVVFTGTNAAFFMLIKAGINLRFKEPSMTLAQMVAAIVAVASILYYAGAIRGGLLLLFLVIIFFGALRLVTRELLVMGALASLAHATVILLLAVNQPDAVDLRVEWVQWAVLTLTLSVSCLLSGYLSSLRRRLSASLRTIREMAQRDALTGVFNRHHMDEVLGGEIARSEQGAPAFLALIADIDHFKKINDAHGHLVGDEVIKVVVAGMQSVLHQADYMARHGGEEFLLIIAAHDGMEAAATCERIRAAVEQLRIPALQPAGVTISIGGTFSTLAIHRPPSSAVRMPRCTGRRMAGAIGSSSIPRHRCLLRARSLFQRVMCIDMAIGAGWKGLSPA